MIPPITPGQTDDKQGMVSWKNTFSMRQISLMNLAPARNGAKSGLPSTRRAYNMTGPANSLDLLRKTLQSAINKDIDSVVKKYLEKFFQPAISNIRTNLGGDCITDDQIQEICKRMLDEAKLMYKIAPDSRDSSPYECSDSEASVGLDRLSPKRKGSDSESEPKRHRGGSGPRREGPKWSPERVTENTVFIMGPRANKVLGFAQTRGRLYARHPELVRYSGDQEDKEWLTGKNLMPPSGGKAYLMLLDDIRELAESDDYRNSPNLQLAEMKGFLVPAFMTHKIRSFIQSEKKPLFELFDFSSSSTTPTNTNLDSGPSTPSEHLGSTSSKLSDFVNVPEMSPSSNQSGVSGQSPVRILSPNAIVAAMGPHSDGEPLKDNGCLSSLLNSHMNSDNSQDF